MAEANAASAITGWIKAGVTSLLGLVGGGALMYVTPLVNSVIKPSKPLANFAIQAQGSSVTFNNRSLNGSQGWWDFGDGSALEPYSPQQDTFTHKFPRPGSYTVKLSLQNLVGDESEHSTNVGVDADVAATKPAIEGFDIQPFTPPGSLPAVYRMLAKVKDADRSLFTVSDGRPVETDETPTGQHERFITFKEAGQHEIRLIAFKGDQGPVEQTKRIVVGSPTTVAVSGTGGTTGIAPALGTVGDMADTRPLATLKVTYEAVHIHKAEVPRNVAVRWTKGEQDATCPFEATRMLDTNWKDFQIIGAAFAHPADATVRNLQVEVTPDKTKFIVRGELVRPTSWMPGKAPPPTWAGTVNLQLERRSRPHLKAMDEIPVRVAAPGTTVIPVPPLSANMQMTRKVMHLELRDGTSVLWSRDDLPTNAMVTMRNRRMQVNALDQGRQLVLQINDASLRTPTGN